MVDATRDLILSCNDIEVKKLVVPGWKDADGEPLDVYIRQFTAEEGEDQLSGVDENGKTKKRQQIKAVTLSLCDSKGNLLFTAEDTEKLAKKNLNTITWLATEIMKFNFNSQGSIEDQAKN